MLLLKNLLFTVVVPGSVVLWLPALVREPEAAFAVSGWRAIGLVFAALGGAIYFWCLWHFARTGMATPAPIDPPKRLVMRGLYRWVRNPMYLGVWSAVLGEALLYRSRNLLIYLVILMLLQYLFVRFYEEPALLRRFGEAYREYCRRVPRWVPRVPR